MPGTTSKNNFLDKKIASRLIDLREERNWSQKYLADKMNMNKVTMNKIEKGNRAITNEEIVKFASIFNVTTDYLLGSSDQKKDYGLTKKEKNDLAVLADKLLEGTTAEAESDYMGEPTTPEQKANLRAAILTALELNRIQSKNLKNKNKE